MSFTDAIKNKVLEGFAASDLTTTGIIVALGIAAVIGIYIFFVYRFTTKSSFYSRSFNKSLAILPVITSAILLAMSSNIVISLGMVGALSIVRFRNAVKDTMDLVFLFWSISAGIIIGAGLFELAVLSTAGISVYIFVLDYIPSLKAPCVIVINAEGCESETEILKVVKKHKSKAVIKSRNLTFAGLELIIELHISHPEVVSNELSAIHGVKSVSLLSHSGELRI